MQHADEEKGGWQDNTRFLSAPRPQTHGTSLTDWEPGKQKTVPSWYQTLVLTLEPGYLWCRMQYLSSECRAMCQSPYTKQLLSTFMIGTSLLLLVVICVTTFHGTLHDPLEVQTFTAVQTATQVVESLEQAHAQVELSETNLLAYMQTHKGVTCKMMRDKFLIEDRGLDLVLLAMRHSTHVEIMWQPRIANSTYDWLNKMWTSSTRTLVENVLPWFCPKHNVGNRTAITMTLFDKLVMEYETSNSMLLFRTPSPTVQSGVWSKEQAHCIQREFIQRNLLSMEQLMMYDYRCEELNDLI